ncbi:MAG TPA: anti-sigma factor [Acidimicrobiales bacterium]|nr:anti-sigma factor [Acidimicrobiales bacterium]
MTHAEIEELLGAYALDAVDAHEALAVEEHLATCPRCRAEVAAHREVAALLGNSGGEAPEGLWSRIASEIDLEFRGRPSLPDISSARRARAATSARDGNGRRVLPLALSLGAIAAALALVVALLSAKVGSLDSQVRTISSAVALNGAAEQAALAATDPRHRSVLLTSRTGTDLTRALLVMLPSGQAYLVAQSGLTALAGDRTYQLWALASGRVVSLGLLGRAPKDVAVQVTSNMTEFMVTAEPLGGTSAPTTPVLAQGSLQ